MKEIVFYHSLKSSRPTLGHTVSCTRSTTLDRLVLQQHPNYIVKEASGPKWHETLMEHKFLKGVAAMYSVDSHSQSRMICYDEFCLIWCVSSVLQYHFLPEEAIVSRCRTLTHHLNHSQKVSISSFLTKPLEMSRAPSLWLVGRRTDLTRCIFLLSEARAHTHTHEQIQPHVQTCVC